MANYKTKSATTKTKTDVAKTASNLPMWVNSIRGEMNIYVNIFEGKKGNRIKYSTSVYRKLKDSDEYINHYINVVFAQKGDNTPFTVKGVYKINVNDAFVGIDYWTNIDGEIGYNPTIFIRGYEVIE